MPHDHGNRDITELLSNMLLLGEGEFKHISSLCALLSDATRLRIFWILCHSEECVINISALMEMSSPAVSHHLNRLKASGLITARREGKEVYYKAAESDEVRLLHSLIESLSNAKCPSHRKNEGHSK